MISLVIDELLLEARRLGCSDLHLTPGLPPIVRLNGALRALGSKGALDSETMRGLSDQLLENTGMTHGDEDLDFCYKDRNRDRYRVNLYCQQDVETAAIRLLQTGIPKLEDLHLPPILKSLSTLPRGMILVTGPTGSGKSTTLAAMIDEINTNRSAHLLTLEDPVEYLHTHKRCVVHQREVGRDVGSFADALRSALREDPDVILVGEMRDLETISAAVTAAETGHLVLSTLHTTGAAATIDRIIDVFPPHQQQQMRTQLAMVLKAVISQQLVPKADGSGRIAALEIMVVTDAIANMIRENKCHQIASVLQTGAKNGMQSMDSNLSGLLSAGIISEKEAFERCIDRTAIRRGQGF